MKIYGLSDTGLIRKENQDSYYYKTNGMESFAIVCDGIGGGNAGDVASKIACDSLAKSFDEKNTKNSDKENKQWIIDVVKKANDEIFSKSTNAKELKGMGTTLAGVLITDASTIVFHCGDSRIYALYEHELISLSEDHNLAADLIKSGELTAKEAATHPKGSMLTNALGIWNDVRVEINKIKTNYEMLLVCSDGLHGFVSDNIIEDILMKKVAIEERAKFLINASNKAGGFDNVSVIVIDKEEQ